MSNVYLHAVDDTNTRTGGGPKWIPVEVDQSGNLKVSLGTATAGERNADGADPYAIATPESEYALVTADTDVSSGSAALLFGVTVIVATATNVIEIRDSASAGTGSVVLSIPASTAIGTYYPCNGIRMDTGLYADFTGTGTLRIDWRLQ